ncbi:MAG TPA: carbohydrate binding domain-containing protein [Bacteroidota bacterium]|nr:carbohydrate binding domain-containing protein [Bacteroidota bacterium]
MNILFRCLFTMLIPGIALAQLKLIPVDGSMEGPYVKGVSKGWENNSFGTNDLVFSSESNDVHGGKFAQKIACNKFVIGGITLRHKGISVEKGQSYTLNFWMKGECQSLIYVAVRKHAAPYTAYLKRYIHVTDQWTKYELSGAVEESDPDCGIYFSFKSTGTIIIDDLELFQGALAQATAGLQEVVKGNKVYNSGFEAGTEGWSGVTVTIDSTSAHSGTHSLRVGSSGIESRPFHVPDNTSFTVSFYAKAAAPNTNVDVTLMEWAGDGTDNITNHVVATSRMNLTGEWVRYSMRGVNKKFLWSDYVLHFVPSAGMNLDDIQFEEGDLTDYKPREQVELGLETATKWCYVGDEVRLTAHIARLGDPGDVHLEYLVEDLWSQSLGKVSHDVGKRTTDEAGFVAQKMGEYRVSVRALGTTSSGETTFGVFPKRAPNSGVRSNLGIHVNPLFPEVSPAFAASEAAGAHLIRLHDFANYCEWYVAEPKKGNYVWFDADIDSLRSHGFEFIATLGLTPGWAGRTGPGRQEFGGRTNALPRDDSEWEQYVYRTVDHYKRSIHQWEIWNEPAGQNFFLGTPQDYVRILSIAYRAAKKADPNCTVLGGCFVPAAQQWAEAVVANDGLKYMDAMAYHIYWNTDMTAITPSTDLTPLASFANWYINIMKSHGVEKPLYMTEGGTKGLPFAAWIPSDGPAVGAFESSSTLVKGIVEMFSAGVRDICYYFAGYPKGVRPFFSTLSTASYMLMDNDGRPKPTMLAYSALQEFLGNAVAVDAVRKNGLSVSVFRTDVGALAVVWSDSSRSIKIEGVAVYDFMGNPTERRTFGAGEPFYVRSARQEPLELLNLLSK